MSVTISRETAELAVLAFQQLNAQQAYHNRMAAIHEIEKALAEPSDQGSPCLACGGRVTYPAREVISMEVARLGGGTVG